MLNALALAAIVMVAAPAFAAGEPAVQPSAIDGAAAALSLAQKLGGVIDHAGCGPDLAETGERSDHPAQPAQRNAHQGPHDLGIELGSGHLGDLLTGLFRRLGGLV